MDFSVIRLSWLFAIVKMDSQLKNSFPKMSLRIQEKSIFHLNGKWQHRNGSSCWLPVKDKSSIGQIEIVQAACSKQKRTELSAQIQTQGSSVTRQLEQMFSPFWAWDADWERGWEDYTYFTGPEFLDLSSMIATGHICVYKFTFKLVIFL